MTKKEKLLYDMYIQNHPNSSETEALEWAQKQLKIVNGHDSVKEVEFERNSQATIH